MKNVLHFMKKEVEFGSVTPIGAMPNQNKGLFFPVIP